MAKKKNEPPKEIKLTPQETDELLARVRDRDITANDAETIAAVLSMVLWLQQQLSRTKLSIKRLKKLFGFTSEASNGAKKNKPGEGDAGAGESGETTSAASDEGKTDSTAPPPDTTTKNTLPANFDPNQNHGRLGVDDYTGCVDVNIPLDETFKQGKCPRCLESGTEATFTYYKPRVVVILHGSPLISGTKYHLDRVRCSICNTYFIADLPDGVDEQQRYTQSCATSIAIHHYGGGLPFKRLETLQKAQGIPLPDATQYDLVRDLHKAVVRPTVAVLRQCAANGSLVHYDDTPGRNLAQIKYNKANPGDKKAIHTTVMLSEYQGHRIYLFDTNTKAAGKEFEALLSMRNVDESFLSMSDASPSNFPYLDESLLAKWIICLCLTHSRRKFIELLHDGADDVKFIIKIIAQIYRHDDYCKAKKLNPEKRLTYHRTRSAPLMDAMRVWLSNTLAFKTVEPNSHLGKAIMYMLKNWDGLTRFCCVAGAPLDNNLCEQAIKVFIRYRKNSLFYRTFYGASIGDAMMSVLHTAAHAGINAFAYLNDLQANAEAVNAAPEQWLPWNYQQTLKALSQQTAHAV